jgi:glycosyltransferase involved in cell wall biosynthesis
MKTISLAITCWHKDLHFLPQTLNYINSQTVKPDEIIVVANNVSELSIEDKSIKTFFVNERKPVSWSRNKAAELSSCDIISFFDVDDIPHPQKIEATKYAFENTDADCFVHGFTENQGVSSEIYKDFQFERVIELTHEGYLKIPTGDNKDLHHGHLAVKTNVILDNPYNEMLGFYERGFQFWGEDTEVCKRLFSSNYKFYYSRCKLIDYKPSYKDMNRNWYYA